MKIGPPPYWLQVVLRFVYPPLAVLVTVAALPLIALGVLLWPVDRRMRLARVVFLAVYFMWEDVSILVQCMWLRVRSPVDRGEDWIAHHEQLVAHALENFFRTAQRVVSFHVVADGEIDLGDPTRPAVVLSRHAGPADSLALAWIIAAKARRVPRVVLAAGLLWDPGLALVLRRLRAYFVPSRSGAGDDRTKGVADLARGLAPRDALLIFPEGRNWTMHRQQAGVEALRAEGEHERAEQAARWRWVLPPRQRGVQAILEARPDADVVVVAHTGLELFDSPGDIWRGIPFGPTEGLLVRTTTYPAGDVPRDPDEVATWLDERWTEVDAWVESHRRPGLRGS